MKHIGWIIILLGALVIVVTSCTSNHPKLREFGVDVFSMDLITRTEWGIGVESRNPNFVYEIISYYDSAINNHKAIVFSDKQSAITFAKRFSNIEIVRHWQDSVNALIKPIIKNRKIEITTVY